MLVCKPHLELILSTILITTLKGKELQTNSMLEQLYKDYNL